MSFAWRIFCKDTWKFRPPPPSLIPLKARGKVLRKSSLYFSVTLLKHNERTKMSIANENEQENRMYIYFTVDAFLDLTKAFDTGVHNPILANNEVITASLVFSGFTFN